MRLYIYVYELYFGWEMRYTLKREKKATSHAMKSVFVIARTVMERRE